MAVASAVQAIIDAANKYGVAPYVPLTIAGWETRGSYNPKSYNGADSNGYSSVGLFQLNTAPGNPGSGYGIGQLESPAFNANIAVAKMQKAYVAGRAQGLTGSSLAVYTANNSGWPGSAGVSVIKQIEPAYDVGLNNFYNANFGSGQAAAQIVPLSSLTTGGASSTTATSFPAGSDPISILNHAMQLRGFSITSPLQSITQDAGAIGLRLVLVILGILIIAFGLLAVVKKAV